MGTTENPICSAQIEGEFREQPHWECLLRAAGKVEDEISTTSVYLNFG